jgi:hypothetical protein
LEALLDLSGPASLRLVDQPVQWLRSVHLRSRRANGRGASLTL